MGFVQACFQAFASVAKLGLSGTKRKASEMEDSQPAATGQQPQAPAGLHGRLPERLDFGSPAWSRRREQLGQAPPPPPSAAGDGEQQLAQPPAAASTQQQQQPAAASAQQQQQQQQRQVMPFVKQFVPPRRPVLPPPPPPPPGIGVSSRAPPQFWRGVQEVRQASPSVARIALTPESLQRLQAARQQQCMQGQQQKDAARLKFAVGKHLEHEKLRGQRRPQSDQVQHLAAAAAAAAAHGSVVDLTLTQEAAAAATAAAPLEQPQAAWQLQQMQGQAGPSLSSRAIALASSGVDWHEMEQKLKETAPQEEAFDGLSGSSYALTFDDVQYQETLHQAAVARRRAAQANHAIERLVRQTHTTLEVEEQRRDAVAEQLDRDLQKIRLQREQEREEQLERAREQERELGRQQQQPKAAALAAEDDVVVLLGSEDEGEEEAVEVSSSAAVSESHEEKSEVSQQQSEVSQQLEEVSMKDRLALLEVPESWREEYASALSPGSLDQVLVDHKRSAIFITRKQMACMARLQWLNDEVINLYIALLVERDTARRSQGQAHPRCHFFSTFFANKLYKDTGYNYDQVRRWTIPKRLAISGQASESILDVDRIVVPVHQGMHWVCAVIDLQQRKFIYYDSLKGEDHVCLEQLALYLRDEYKNKRNQQRDDVLDWPREFPKRIPQQRNGCDCGVFTLLFANYVGLGAAFNFSQGDIDDLRLRIVHELLHLSVD